MLKENEKSFFLFKKPKSDELKERKVRVKNKRGKNKILTNRGRL